MRVLHAASEAFPYVKVGGLADVAGALPQALRALGVDARLLLPGFPGVLDALPELRVARQLAAPDGAGAVRLLAARGEGDVPLYVVDAPALFARSRDPYADFGDSHLRAATLSRAAAEIAERGAGDAHDDETSFVPDLVHCHDWQTALAPAYLSLEGARARSVMTIHNLAYQGHYARGLLTSLGLPESAFHLHGVEFWGGVNLLKTGLVYATRITTVSPSYAREIQTPGGGHGLDGVLRERSAQLSGILNGIDSALWDPATSPHLAVAFDAERLAARAPNKPKLQEELGLVRSDAPLFGVVSRLNTMKGLDLLAASVDHLVALGGQLAVLGRGDPALESAFREAAARHPGRVALSAAHDERRAHRMFAGVDVLVVPSRSEPCGLTQLYAMRYGALPLAHWVGGLADTVTDETLGSDANGFSFDEPTAAVLGDTLTRAARLYRDAPRRFRELQLTGMRRDSGWRRAAKQYVDVYEEALAR